MQRMTLANAAARSGSHRSEAVRYANERLFFALHAAPDASPDDAWDAAVDAAFRAKRIFGASVLVKRTADGGVAIR